MFHRNENQRSTIENLRGRTRAWLHDETFSRVQGLPGSCSAVAGCLTRRTRRTAADLPVTVNGKRIKTIDVHAHCLFHESLALMGDEAET